MLNWSKFSRWRKTRPFYAGLVTLLSALVLQFPAIHTLNLGDLVLAVSSDAGTSIFLLNLLLVACGISMWVKPEFRLPAGVITMVIAVLSLKSSNLGGFVVGTVLGLIGGALALSWSPSEQPSQVSLEHREHDEQVLAPFSPETPGHNAPDEHTPAASSPDDLSTSEPKEPPRRKAIVERNVPQSFQCIVAFLIICAGTIIPVSPSSLTPQPTVHAHPNPSVGTGSTGYRSDINNVIYHVYSSHLGVDYAKIGPIRYNNQGFRYFPLYLGPTRMDNFHVAFTYKHGFRQTLTSKPGSTTLLLPGGPHPKMSVIELRALTADISLTGQPLGRWTIDLNGVPMQLLHLLGIAGTSLPANIMSNLSLDNVDLETYKVESNILRVPLAEVADPSA